ncbi:MAG: HAMP domain-containing protein, partial [Bacteroidales bacterium]|nr:HAMP domain-containing protein [Bacteroidales bacterium]
MPDLTSTDRLSSSIVKEKLAQDDELRDEIRSISLNNEFVSDSLMVEGPSDFEGVGNETSKVAEAIDTLFNLLIITFAIGFLFNLPYKRYFKLRRQRKKIPRRLYKFCKKYILYIPEINSSIVGFSFISILGFELMWIINDQFQGRIQKEIFVQYFYISIIATILSIFFIFFWEKHRVHIKYIDQFYSPEELQRRIFKTNAGKIRNRLIISSIMTTMLPLTIVLLYLFLGYTNLSDIDIDENNKQQIQTLFGNNQLLNGSDGKSILGVDNVYNYFFYYNAWDSLFMFIGIFTGIALAFIYIFIFVRWTTSYILSPVNELLDNMKLSGQGDMSHYSVVRTNDEIGQLTEGFNQMSMKIGKHISNISMM